MPTGNSERPGFSEWLRTLRGEKSLREFADSLGVDPSYLQRIESGERPPSEMLCIRIARATGEKLATVLEIAGFAEKGEFDDDITDEEHEIHRRLARFKSPEARVRAIEAAIAVIDSLAESESKTQNAPNDPQRAPARRPATS